MSAVQRAPELELQGLRTALREISDALLQRPRPPHPQLLDAVRHAWALADIEGVGEGVVRLVLRNLQRDLIRKHNSLDVSYFAQQLVAAADRLPRR